MTNFNPSAKGCRTPKKPTTEGPSLRWTAAISFLSAKVKKDIDNITGNKIINV